MGPIAVRSIYDSTYFTRSLGFIHLLMSFFVYPRF